jgi:hypothetical protein
VKPEHTPAIQADRAPRKSGRKPASQSGAVEIRARLQAWKQTPEPQRTSLRALAIEIGTSHQLLSFYLARWDRRQATGYRRQAKEIRIRAEAETYPWIVSEMQRQAQALEKAAFQSMIGSVLDDTLRQLKRKARHDQLSRDEVRMLRLLASRGFSKARRVLDRIDRDGKSQKIICH